MVFNVHIYMYDLVHIKHPHTWTIACPQAIFISIYFSIYWKRERKSLKTLCSISNSSWCTIKFFDLFRTLLITNQVYKSNYPWNDIMFNAHPLKVIYIQVNTLLSRKSTNVSLLAKSLLLSLIKQRSKGLKGWLGFWVWIILEEIG